MSMIREVNEPLPMIPSTLLTSKDKRRNLIPTARSVDDIREAPLSSDTTDTPGSRERKRVLG